MKDTHQIFDEYFLSLIEPLKESIYRSCGCISNDIIRFSEIVGFDDGVFIGEVFESIFNEIDTELSRYQTADDTHQALKINLLKSISMVSKCYEETNKTELYNALKGMRLTTTRFQYILRRQCKIKQQTPPFPFQLR